MTWTIKPINKGELPDTYCYETPPKRYIPEIKPSDTHCSFNFAEYLKDYTRRQGIQENDSTLMKRIKADKRSKTYGKEAT
jgi:hypothetical protein